MSSSDSPTSNESTTSTSKMADPQPKIMKTVVFEKIVEFVNALWVYFGAKKDTTPLTLYHRLLSHITLSDQKAIEQAISGFDTFFRMNPEVVKTRNLFIIPRDTRIEYSKAIHLEIQKYIHKMKKDSAAIDTVMKHLLLIYGLLHPEQNNNDVVESLLSETTSASVNESDGSEEEKFLDKIISKTNSTMANTANNLANPTDAFNELVNSGVLQDMMKGMTDGFGKGGKMNPAKFMSVLQKTMGKVMGGDGSGGFENLLGSLTGGGGAGGMGGLASMLSAAISQGNDEKN